jgi:hypothetical protein
MIKRIILRKNKAQGYRIKGILNPLLKINKKH